MENKKTSVMLNASRAVNSSVSGVHQINRSSRQKWSITGSHRLSSILVGGRNSRQTIPERGGILAPKKTVRVLDVDGNDVAPVPLNQSGTGDVFTKPGRYFLEEIFTTAAGSDYSKSASSFMVPANSSFIGSSRASSLSAKMSMTRDADDSIHRLDTPIHHLPSLYDVQRKRDTVKQQVTEEMLDEMVDICLSETDTISLMDMPNTFVSQDDDDAEAIIEGNMLYDELCKNRLGNDKYVIRSMQTFSGAPKSKQTQSDMIDMVDKGTFATLWDIYDSYCGQSQTAESEKADFPESGVNATVGQSKGEKSSTVSTVVDTGSCVSLLLEMEMCGASFNTEADLQLIMSSEAFRLSLLVMERSVTANVFQPKLALYRTLPILEDPDITVKPEPEEESEESEEDTSAPALELLWGFSCDLTKGCNITSMAWNKENTDLLAVGYGDCDSGDQQKPGLICCWSLKNLTWPERVFNCRSCVTSLDFSANNPGQLAVGMYDGTVAIYNVQSLNKSACIASSRACLKKHLHPVWQVTWTRQEMTLSGEDQVEALVSVSADGRIAKWLVCSNGLECIELMKLQRSQNKKKPAGAKKTQESVLSSVTPGLCVDFHPRDSSIYLAGTWDGLIHKCSFSNSQHFLDTYQKHLCPVNHVEWSPFCPDVFLSCSSDWTVQLWKQDLPAPVISFTSVQRAVFTARWSPNWSTVFATLNGQQLEIWDLNANILYPTLVHYSPPGVRVTSLLFATGTDCVMVGDSDGQVSVYQLKNLNVGEQLDSLEDIINSAVAR